MKRILLVVLSLLFLAQCGDQDNNADIEVGMNPTNPVIFLSPLPVTVGEREKTIQPPSFSFYLRLMNKTKENLYIVAVTFKIMGTKNGASFEGKRFALGPGDVLDNNGDPRKLNIAELNPGEEFSTLDPIFVEGLPDVETGAADSFVFTVEGIVEAYTGESISRPNRNIRRRFSFITSPPN